MKYQSSITKLILDIDFDTNSKKLYKCPECSDERKNKKAKTLQFYPDTKRGYCFHCNTTFFEYKPYENEKQYIIPPQVNKTNLSDKAVEYFNNRRIKQQTLIDCKIYTDNIWMPQFNKEIEVISFPFYKGGQLINVKYRGAKKSFRLVSGAELIWWNIDVITEYKEIIICEGEIDGLTFYQQGFKNVISVPAGANLNLEYLDSSIHLFENVEKIIIATDNDTKGIELKEELIRRFGAEMCYTVNFKECKDANEYLMKYGGFDFGDIIKNMESIPIVGNVEIPSFYSEIIDLYENGLQKGADVNVPEIDEFCTWELSRLATVTGIPGSGKSEFVDYIVTRLNYLYKWKVAYFTPENYPLKYHYSKLHEKFSGSKFKKETDNTDFLSIYEHIKENFFYIMNEEDLTVESILKSAKAYIKQKGIKILVIDPYNKLDHQHKNNENETQYISRFLDELTNFAKFNNILIFLIAHPRKMQRGDVPNLYDISGSANFYNKTDYGLTVHRTSDENNLMTNSVEVHWQKIKFKHLGEQGVSKLNYNINNGRFDANENYDNNDWITDGIEKANTFENNFTDSVDDMQPNTNFTNFNNFNDNNNEDPF